MKLRTFAATLVLALLSAFMALPTSGCALFSAAVSALPTVIAAVTDAGQIVDAIERFIGIFIAQHPDTISVDVQRKITDAVIKTRATLNAITRVAQGTKNADDQNVDAAFNDFKAAYMELLALTSPYGVHQSAVPSGMAMKATPGSLVVPEPLAFKRAAK